MRKNVKPLFWRMMTVVLLSLTTASSAYALHFEFGDGVTLDWDTTLRYTIAQRVQKQDKDLLPNFNADDGNRNFDRGSLIKNRFDAITEADLNFGEFGFFDDFGAFARARGWYDFVYHKSNDHDSPLTNNSLSADYDEFTDDTKKWHGEKAEMLDYFLYSKMNLGGRSATLRVGQQALNWGETLFLVGGVMSSQGPIDATGFSQPGAELKELFLPVEQVAVQLDLTDNVSMEGYYQWEWQPYRLDAAGSYFSTADILDAGGESYILSPAIPLPTRAATRGKDDDPRDSGQWGVALRYFAEGLAGTEFGFYYINYHDQLPQLEATDIIELIPGSGIYGPSKYNLKYAEDVRLAAASFGTAIGLTNISGEVAYRANVPVAVPGALPTYERAEVMHYSLSAIQIFKANALMDNLSLTAEVGADQVLNKDNDELSKDGFAWGYSFTLKPIWKQVLPKLDVNLPIALSQGVNGDSVLGASFVEDKNKVGVTLDLLYDDTYQAQLGYVCYFGASAKSAGVDRDYVSLNFKYAF